MSVNIAKTLSPRRGKTSSMTNSDKKNIILAAGELFIEYPDTGLGTSGTYKIKIGDGENKYCDLPYALNTHPASGVTPGSYNRVTVNDTGHVTAGDQNFAYPAVITAANTGLTAKTIIAKTSAGYKSLGANVSLDITYPILYTGTAVSASATTNSAIMMGLCDVSGTYTFNNSGSVLYAKGLINGTMFTINAFTTTIPSTDDGYEYLDIGVTAGQNLVVLTPSHNIYKYANGIFARYSDSGDFGSEDPLSN